MFGAQFRNNNQVIQIDETTPCMSLVRTGRFNANNNTSDFSVSQAGCQTPLLAIRPNNFSAAIASQNVTSGVWSWYVQGWDTPRTAPGNWSVDWYLFDKPASAPSTSGWGIELYKNGVVTYSSKNPPMKIAGVNLGTYPAGRTYAFHQSRMAIEQGEMQYDSRDIEDSRGNPTGEFEIIPRGYEKVPSGWEIIGTQVAAYKRTNTDYWIEPNNLLVLDVSGLVSG